MSTAIVFIVEPIDKDNCNVKLNVHGKFDRKTAYKMTEALESAMFNMVDRVFTARGKKCTKKGGKNGKN